MYNEKRICIVIPAFNEECNIASVIKSIPDFVDQIVIVDDHSRDRTNEIVKEYQKKSANIHLITHDTNRGVGAALASGYKWANTQDFDIIVRMDGDGQMDPNDLLSLIDPVAQDFTDYAKGNRFHSGEAYQKMPKIRFFGNAFLSLLTKIASGYWHIADFQSGYTAMNKKVLNAISWDHMYRGYGQPNDLIVRLNVHNFRILDVPIKPIYNVGEKSGLKIGRIMFSLSFLLLKLFMWRLKEKYIIRDFHPLVFFYAFGSLFSFITICLFLRVCYFKLTNGLFPPSSSLAMMFSFMSSSLFLLFAMWFDMEANKDLKAPNVILKLENQSNLYDCSIK